MSDRTRALLWLVGGLVIAAGLATWIYSAR